MAFPDPTPTLQEPFSTVARDAFLLHINSSGHKNQYCLDGFKQLQIKVSNLLHNTIKLVLVNISETQGNIDLC
jgi:hypothetical protein